MQSETGFFYLNLANEWAKFDLLDPNITIASNGALTLARTTGDVFATRGVFRGGPFTRWTGQHPGIGCRRMQIRSPTEPMCSCSR